MYHLVSDLFTFNIVNINQTCFLMCRSFVCFSFFFLMFSLPFCLRGRLEWMFQQFAWHEEIAEDAVTRTEEADCQSLISVEIHGSSFQRGFNCCWLKKIFLTCNWLQNGFNCYYLGVIWPRIWSDFKVLISVHSIFYMLQFWLLLVFSVLKHRSFEQECYYVAAYFHWEEICIVYYIVF